MLTRRKDGFVFWGMVLPLVIILLTHCGQPSSPQKANTGTGGTNPTGGCSFATAFAGGGDGSTLNPYQVNSFCDFQAILAVSSNWTKSFKLMQNFDLQASDFGYTLDTFTGVLDGNNKTITNYQSNHSLIETLTGTVKNLTLVNAQVTSSQITRVAILVNTVSSTGQIVNCSVSGGVSAGITSTFVGAVAALNQGVIQRSNSTASVFGGSAVGGFVGHNSGTITKSSGAGSLNGNVFVSWFHGAGGFAGSNSGTIVDSFSSTSVQGTSYVGGFVGSNGGVINRSYSRGLVAGTGTGIGGLAGENSSPNTGSTLNGTVTNSYWDNQTSNQASSAAGTSSTTAQMQTQSTFTGWDFVGTWFPPSSGVYPALR